MKLSECGLKCYECQKSSDYEELKIYLQLGSWIVSLLVYVHELKQRIEENRDPCNDSNGDEDIYNCFIYQVTFPPGKRKVYSVAVYLYGL